MIRGKKKLFVSALAIAVCCMGVSSVKAEERNGKVLTIYKNADSLSDVSENGKEIGKITCSTNDCKVVTDENEEDGLKYIFSNGYVVVNENGKYVLYNYETDTIEYGPYGKVRDGYNLYSPGYNETLPNYDPQKPNEKPLFYFETDTSSNPLYAIGIEENGLYSIYSLLTKKKVDNLEGDIPFQLIGSSILYDVNEFVKNNKIVISDGKKWNVISLETGNKIFDFESNAYLQSFGVDGHSYIVASLSANEMLLYDSNGTLMFNGEKILISNIYGCHFAKTGSKWMLILSNSNSDGYYNGIQFAIYENGKITKKSKMYNSILSMNDYEGQLFAVVLDGENVNLIDENEKIITTFVSLKDKKFGRSSLLQVENGIFSLQLEFIVGNETVDSKYAYDYKNSMTLNKTCPNDSKIDITACMTSGKTEEDCILIHCPGAGKVENPKTGMYVTAVLILSCITGMVLFVLKGKNYLKRM